MFEYFMYVNLVRNHVHDGRISHDVKLDEVNKLVLV